VSDDEKDVEDNDVSKDKLFVPKKKAKGAAAASGSGSSTKQKARKPKTEK
jgi:hypothetical protein